MVAQIIGDCFINQRTSVFIQYSYQYVVIHCISTKYLQLTSIERTVAGKSKYILSIKWPPISSNTTNLKRSKHLIIVFVFAQF